MHWKRSEQAETARVIGTETRSIFVVAARQFPPAFEIGRERDRSWESDARRDPIAVHLLNRKRRGPFEPGAGIRARRNDVMMHVDLARALPSDLARHNRNRSKCTHKAKHLPARHHIARHPKSLS